VDGWVHQAGADGCGFGLVCGCLLDVVAHAKNDVRRDRLCDLEWHWDRVDRAGGMAFFEAESGFSGHRGYRFGCRRGAGYSLVFQFGETLMGNLIPKLVLYILLLLYYEFPICSPALLSGVLAFV
jgi:hypothetical protein